MKNMMLLFVFLGFSGVSRALAAEVETLDRATNVFATSVRVSSSSIPTVRIGQYASVPTVVLNAPGQSPVYLQNVSGKLSLNGVALTTNTITGTDIAVGNDLTVGNDADITGDLVVGGDLTGATSITSPMIIATGPARLYSRTLEQILALTPEAAGEMIYCSNCQNDPVCISTGTAIASYSSISDKAAACE